MPTEKNFGMRLAPHERHVIERLARARGTNMKEAILDAVRRHLAELAEADEQPFTPRPGGPLDGLDDLIGATGSGLPDLATNEAHMEGYGR